MRAMVWAGLLLPASVTPDATQAMLLGLATLPRNPRLVLEAIGREHRVAWRIGADNDVTLRRACQVLRTHIPGLLIIKAPHGLPDTASSREIAATQLRFSRSRELPLAGDHLDTVCRSVLAALASASPQETVLLQVVLGIRRRPHSPGSQGRGPVRQAEVRHHF